jgi:hypothetical protein
MNFFTSTPATGVTVRASSGCDETLIVCLRKERRAGTSRPRETLAIYPPPEGAANAERRAARRSTVRRSGTPAAAAGS